MITRSGGGPAHPAIERVDAEVLDVPPGSPTMLREGLNGDDAGAPTLFLTRRMRGDRIKYVLLYDTSHD